MVMVGYAEAAAFALHDPERPGLILALHGLTGTLSQPLDLLSGFDSPAFGVLAPDLRAHGDTGFAGNPACFTPQQLAADVESLVRSLRLAPATVRVVGISLGAVVALELVRRGNLPIDRAVFVRPAHDVTAPVNLKVNLLIARLLRANPQIALDKLVASDEYRAVAAVSAKAAQGLRAKVTGPVAAQRVMRLERGSVWSAFTHMEALSLRPRILVVGAAADPLHPVEIAKSWHVRLHGSQLVILPAFDPDPDAHLRAARTAVREFLGAPHLSEEGYRPDESFPRR
jgi:pimeloyl-ACP methyl ester carboxylesterase